MSRGHGATIARDGLVFYYDQSNIQKSWEGAPATNLFTETNLNNWTKSGATTATSTLVTPFGDTAYNITDSSTTGYSSIQRNITVPNDSASYTMSLMVRKTTGGTSARLGFNVSLSGGTQVALNPRFNSDTGVTTNGIVIDYGDWWYWYYTITNNSTGNTTLNHSFFPATSTYNASDNVLGIGTALIGSVMLVDGSVAARFVNGTRSNTQAILNLAGQNAITASSLAYGSDNTFSFDGTNNYINFSKSRSDLGIVNTYSLEAIFKRTTNDAGRIILGGQGWNWGIMTTTNGCRVEHFYSSNGGTSYNYLVSGDNVVTTGTWVHVIATFNHLGNMCTYINGTLTSTTNMSAYTNFWYNSALCVGGYNYAPYRFTGQIPVAKVYTKELSAAEVQQNFNALRGRYGI